MARHSGHRARQEKETARPPKGSATKKQPGRGSPGQRGRLITSRRNPWDAPRRNPMPSPCSLPLSFCLCISCQARFFPLFVFLFLTSSSKKAAWKATLPHEALPSSLPARFLYIYRIQQHRRYLLSYTVRASQSRGMYARASPLPSVSSTPIPKGRPSSTTLRLSPLCARLFVLASNTEGGTRSVAVSQRRAGLE